MEEDGQRIENFIVHNHDRDQAPYDSRTIACTSCFNWRSCGYPSTAFPREYLKRRRTHCGTVP
ncbi:hypothetical protein BDM02DRAFT_3123301, partial [Thelephora ganbajun]